MPTLGGAQPPLEARELHAGGINSGRRHFSPPLLFLFEILVDILRFDALELAARQKG